jgi:AAA15 family ATPase/GTPase
MIKQINLKNYGPLNNVSWDNCAPINLIIGDNGSGKTFLLKALYASIRTLEEYQRGDSIRSESDILSEKLHWLFQADKIGDLVTKGDNKGLSCSIMYDKSSFEYDFGRDTKKQIKTIRNTIHKLSSNSVYIPAKEVLSLHRIIQSSRTIEQSFGFDDTYLDLIKALQYTPINGEHGHDFSSSKKTLSKIIGGSIEYDTQAGKWFYKKDNQKYSMGVTADGIKKAAILEALLQNRYLGKGSIVFIDEPEAALHPSAISLLMEAVFELTQLGIQFFLSSHSYFVVKKLYILSQQSKQSLPLLSLVTGKAKYEDLLEGMPDNPIINESIRLYKDEVSIALS